jgi:hypothetical protein
MCTSGVAFLILLLSCEVLVYAQPNRAVDLYNGANKQAERGKLDQAIEGYTQALKASSLLVYKKSSANRFTENTTIVDSSVEASARITTNDAFTAKGWLRHILRAASRGERRASSGTHLAILTKCLP